jgi:hypothetical protein
VNSHELRQGSAKQQTAHSKDVQALIDRGPKTANLVSTDYHLPALSAGFNKTLLADVVKTCFLQACELFRLSFLSEDLPSFEAYGEPLGSPNHTSSPVLELTTESRLQEKGGQAALHPVKT